MGDIRALADRQRRHEKKNYLAQQERGEA